MRDLEGKSVLVMGGANGIGRAVCAGFAASGAEVACADLAPPEANGEAALSLVCDVREDMQIKDAVTAAIAAFGKIDILVNNAGIGSPAAALQDVDWAVWEAVLAVNLKGTVTAMRAVIPHMLARGYGRIINTASQLAHKPAPFQGAYCASKAAVVALTVSAAQELADKGITVNCVCPGPTETALWAASDPAWIEWKLGQLPIRRVGTTSEIASAYLYLASDAASYMIGQTISPNGGDVCW